MHQAPFSTPILFIIFNRPETTQAVLNAIRSIKPPRLYVAADGPRPGVETDLARCAEARRIIEQVDWKCEVKTLFREDNLNCGLGPSSAMSWFFDHEPEGIILEDDCLPSESFFWFCQELLEKYRFDERVMHIGGNNFLGGERQAKEYSYYFSRCGHIWGWATWQRAWKTFDYDILLYEKVKKEGFFEDFFVNWLERKYRLSKFDRTVALRGKVDWWDYQWDFARYINSGLAIVPEKNLVRNVGFGEDATHTISNHDRNANIQAGDLEFPLKHPPFVVRDIVTDEKYFSKVIRDAVFLKIRG